MKPRMDIECGEPAAQEAWASVPGSGSQHPLTAALPDVCKLLKVSFSDRSLERILRQEVGDTTMSYVCAAQLPRVSSRAAFSLEN